MKFYVKKGFEIICIIGKWKVDWQYKKAYQWGYQFIKLNLTSLHFKVLPKTLNFNF